MAGRYVGGRYETPGADIDEARPSVCKTCKAALVLGLVRNVAGTLKWRNFDAKAIERNGRRFYISHHCPR